MPLPVKPDWKAQLAQFDAELAEMAAGGLSYGQIARKLNLSRGAVAGRVYRHQDRVRLGRI